jgi:uncharacterized protein YdaU (DUF1376 family)
MAEFPTLPLFTDAILGDTMHLSIGQFGAYMMLLIVEWRSKDCALPNDDVYLARICRMDKRTWLSNKEIILEFFKIGEDTKLRQLRLVDERNYVEEQRNKNSEAGKASALKRKGRHKATVATELEPETNQPIPIPIPNQLAGNDAGKNAPFQPSFCDNEVLPTAWQDYAELKRIPDEQIFKSWRKFKEVSAFPYDANRWKAWVDRERIAA